MTILPYRPAPAADLSLPEKFARSIDNRLASSSPSAIIIKTLSIVALARLAIHLIERNWPRPLRREPIAVLKYLIRFIPKYDRKIVEEYAKFRQNLEAKIFANLNPDQILTELPKEGLSREMLLERYQTAAGTTHNGKNTGAVYCADPVLMRTQRKAAKLGSLTNPLHLNLAPMVRQLEAEVCSMIAKKFHGDDAVRGNITSGGTESIHHALYATRERARAMGITSGWEIILPTTAHPAFRKSAHQLCIRVVDVPVYPNGHSQAYQVNVEAIGKKITPQTILVVGSLPGFPQGICDPIESISDLLEKKDPDGYIGLHVDSCLGGFVIPFMRQAGFDDGPERFGFDVKRVSSISADTHKYGGDEKGSSLILFRDENWKRHLVYVDKDWPGGIYATPTLPGSRPGSVILRVHAVLSYMGDNGYVAQTKKIIDLTRALTERVRQNPHLKLLGEPKAMVLAFTFHDPQYNIHDLNEKMTQKGWYLSGLQKPNGMHLCITPVHAKDPNFADTFMKDLEDSIAAVLAMPEHERGKSSDARTYGSNEKMDESMFVSDFAAEYWNVASQPFPKTFSFSKKNEDAAASSSS